MAKHPVPKKKTSKARTSRRYKHFQNLAQARLGKAIQVVDCPSCGESIKQHTICGNCGNYRGKDLAKKVEAAPAAEVKTIKAD